MSDEIKNNNRRVIKLNEHQRDYLEKVVNGRMDEIFQNFDTNRREHLKQNLPVRNPLFFAPHWYQCNHG